MSAANTKVNLPSSHQFTGTAQMSRGAATRAMQNDPVDIDDDVSDHGPDNVTDQIKALDGMNKYMNNVRVPTRFIDTDPATQGITLQKMRQEARHEHEDVPGMA